MVRVTLPTCILFRANDYPAPLDNNEGISGRKVGDMNAWTYTLPLHYSRVVSPLNYH